MRKVKLGFFSFTEITRSDQHRAYNEWHMLDHMPEQLPIPGIAWGQRWVSTPRCREARLAADPLIAPTHYVTCYFLAEPIERTLADFFDWADQLRALGRFFPHRRAHLGGPFLLAKAYANPRVLISPEAIPYRPNRGVIAFVWDPVEGADTDERGAWLDRVHFPDLLGVHGAAGLWSFVSRPGRDDVFTSANPPGRRVALLYLDEEPLAAMTDLRDKLEQWRDAGRLPDFEKRLHPVFAGPLETITPWQWDWFEGEG